MYMCNNHTTTPGIFLDYYYYYFETGVGLDLYITPASFKYTATFLVLASHMLGYKWHHHAQLVSLVFKSINVWWNIGDTCL